MLAGRNNTTTTAGRRVWHLEYGRPLVHWIFKEKKKLSKLEKSGGRRILHRWEPKEFPHVW